MKVRKPNSIQWTELDRADAERYLRRRMGGLNMKEIIFMMLLIITNITYACDVYEYSDLSVVEVKERKNGKAVAIEYLVIYETEDIFGAWKNNDPYGGFGGKSLKEYFEIEQINGLKILNGLGRSGWKPYSYNESDSGTDQTGKYWLLMRCVK